MAPAEEEKERSARKETLEAILMHWRNLLDNKKYDNVNEPSLPSSFEYLQARSRRLRKNQREMNLQNQLGAFARG